MWCHDLLTSFHGHVQDRSQPSLEQESWRQYQEENEEDAMARALELSRLEHLQRTEEVS